MNPRLVKYFLVGGTAAAVDFTIFFAAVTGLGMPWFRVAIFSFIIATLTNYLLSIRFVFESRVRFRRRVEVILVFLASAGAMAVNQFILWLTIDVLTLNLVLSKVLGTGTVFLFNYGCRQYFIFRPKSARLPVAPTQQTIQSQNLETAIALSATPLSDQQDLTDH